MLLRRVKWASLIEPSIELARDGFTLSNNTAHKIETHVDCAADTALADVFCDDQQQHLRAGDTVKLPSYANLLERIARHGIDVFYDSDDVTDEIIDTVRTTASTAAVRLASSKRTCLHIEAVVVVGECCRWQRDAGRLPSV